MKKIMALLMVGLMLMVSACSTLERQAGSVVSRYCDAVTDQDQALIRERLDSATDPNRVRVHCDRMAKVLDDGD